MDPEPQATGDPAPVKGLPPVAPPSGRHIVQMFVVPGLIVGVVVLILLGCTGLSNWFLGISGAPEDFLTELESNNPDRRWRAAERLAQELRRDHQLAADPRFCLKLAELLEQELNEMDRHEKLLLDQSASMSPKELQREKNDYRTRRRYLQYLSALVGNLALPVGAPELIRMADKEGGPDPKSTAFLRRHAVWVLANLGENQKRLDKLTAKQHADLLAKYEIEALTAEGKRRDRARSSYLYLKGREYQNLAAEARQEQLAQLKKQVEKAVSADQAGQHELAIQLLEHLQNPRERGVIATLARCAAADDPDLRTMTAFALSFWDGSARETELADKALVRLSVDEAGQGTRILLGKDD